MIPRSERLFFNIEGSPPVLSKNAPLALDKAQSTPNMQTSARWNGGKNTTIVKDARKLRGTAPATPWRPRISRKTPAATVEDHDEQPSPLDRKIPSNVAPLRLGSKPEANVLSSAPTSATLAPGCDNSEEHKEAREAVDACRREPEPAATKLQQREEWHGDRWGMLRSECMYEEARAKPSTQLPIEQPMFRGVASRSVTGSGEAPYIASRARGDACLALDMNKETNVYVNGLPKEMDDHMLYLLGSACGVVISHKAMMNRQTGLCKGFGFLMYSSSEMAKKAIEWLNSHGFTSSFAKESFSARLRRMADAGSTNVYLSNLPIKLTEQQLEQLFNPHPVASLKILYDVHGESRGVGFVRLYDRATAKLCIDRLHGRILPGTTLPLQVRFADSEAQKQLKHSVNQKHTLESLGLLSRLGDAGSKFHQGLGRDLHGTGLGGRAQTTSEVKAAVGRAPLCMATASSFEGGSRTFSQPFIPAAVSMPVPSIYSPLASDRALAPNGLGIDVPNHLVWPRSQAGQMVDPAVWSSVPAARVVYSGVEGSYAMERAYPVSPVIVGMWEDQKAREGNAVSYVPVSLFPPSPGLTHPSHGISVDHSEGVHEKGHANYGSARLPGRPQPETAVRVRFPGGPSDAGLRAVSDPMAMLAAQARVREALGLPERVRAAVSADNSMDVGDETANTSLSCGNSSSGSEDEDSLSIDIQIHADQRAA